MYQTIFSVKTETSWGWKRTNQGLKRPCWENMTLKWAAKSPGLIVLIMITSSERLLFQVPKATDVDGIKIYDKNDQAAKLCSLYLNVSHPKYLNQIFDSINIRGSWVLKITGFYSEVIMIKIIKPIKSRIIWFRFDLFLENFTKRQSVFHRHKSCTGLITFWQAKKTYCK